MFWHFTYLEVILHLEPNFDDDVGENLSYEVNRILGP